MSTLTFHQPQLLWLLGPALLLSGVLLWLDRRQGDALGRFVSSLMQARLAARLPRTRRWLRLLCVSLTLALGVLALARPQTPGEVETVSTAPIAADLVVVLDVSRSMLAEDAAPNRLQRAKAEIADLLAKLKGHRVGLVAFAGRAQVLCPLTPDFGFFRMILDRTDPHSIGRGGTRIGDGLRQAKAAFASGPGARLVLLITDGEDHDSFPLEAAQELKRDGIRVVAIGFGDERGSEITLTDATTGARSFLVDREGQLVRSRLDGKTLRDIALATQGAYIPAGVAALDLESIIREHIQPLVREGGQAATQTQPKEHYPLLILLSLLALIASVRLSVGARRVRWDQLAGSESFGPALGLCVLLGVLAASPARVWATPTGTPAPAPAAAAPAADPATGPSAAAKPAPKEVSGSPRQRYNRARQTFAQGDFAAAETAFLSARDAAEDDDELRFRAAFNVALAQAQRAAGLAKEQPQEAVSALQQSAAWFRDAVRLRPSDADARHNLELVLRRMQILRDQLNKGQNTLEARLARILADERTLRDRIRGLLARIAQAGASDEPLAFHGEFEDASTFQRTLLSEAGAVLDLAGDERDRLSQRAEKDRKPEEQARLIQLQNLEHYLNLARTTLADVARLLRRLQGDRAHRQADLAVTQLKRAQEQLQDPVTVLKGLVADQMGTLGQTRALGEAQAQSQRLGSSAPSPAAPTPASPAAPVWLTSSLLADEQREIKPRTDELLARLRAGVEHAAQNPPAANPPSGQAPGDGAGADPREAAARERMLQAAREAIPLLSEATTAMDQAQTALAGEQLANALRGQASVVALLLRALERFSGVRDLIELTYGDQLQLVQILGGAAKAELAKLPAAERAALVNDAVARNHDRLARLAGLFSDELKALQKAPTAPAGGGGEKDKEAEQARQAETQRYEQAEKKRQAAEVALTRLATLIAAKNPTLLPTAEEGRDHLAELRRLFFSIIEHLKELLRNQGETLDHTNTAQAQKAEADRRRRAGPLAGEEERHAELGKALGDALAAQADQAGQAQDPQAKQAQKPLGEAAEEVRKAHGAMVQATTLLKPEGQAAHSAAQGQSMPLDLEPAMEQEKKAIGHLETAIRILEPPQQKPQQQNQKQQQQQEQQQLSQEQAARRLQAIREREAERQRKRQQQPSANQPVEKDW